MVKQPVTSTNSTSAIKTTKISAVTAACFLLVTPPVDQPYLVNGGLKTEHEVYSGLSDNNMVSELLKEGTSRTDHTSSLVKSNLSDIEKSKIIKGFALNLAESLVEPDPSFLEISEDEFWELF